jgi:TetR/AcrR family transcriptional regulator, transcriptional repressor for nem operon
VTASPATTRKAATPEEHSTREKIVRAAMRLFWAEGYHPTPISRILAEAGVHSGSLYYFFPSKRDLLIAVLDFYLANIWPMLLEPVWSAHSDPLDRVFGLLEAYRRNVVATDCRYCPIGNLAIEIADPDPEIRKRIAANFDQWIAAVEGCLVDAGDRLPAGIDRHALASYVLTTMEGAVMQARVQRTVTPFDASIAALRDYFDRLQEAASPALRAVAARPA